MPGGSLPVTPTNSQLSKKYRTRSKESSVDETLFSKPIQPKVQQQYEFVVDKKKPLFSPVDVVYKKPRKPKAVRLFTKDLVRDLVVPTEDPSGKTVILAGSKYSSICKAAEVQSKEEIRRNRELAQMEKERTALEKERRLEALRRKDLERVKNEKLGELDLEAKQKSQYLLENAIAKRLEQEEDIKRLNELCSNARCHATRDAQVVEKQVISEEEVAEKKRLDDMMEIDRINAIKQQEQLEEIRRLDRYKGAAQIMKQIETKAENKLMEMEQKDQDCLQMLKYLEKLQEEDLVTLDVKRVRQKKLFKEMNQILAEYDRQKKERKEQDLAADKRVLEFLEKKEEKEIEKEMEQKRIRKEREKEIAKLRDLQEKAIDVHTEKLAIRLKRNQEQQERDWRRREEKEAFKKAETNAILKRAREEQVKAKHSFMAIEAQRDRREFERVLRELRRQIEADRIKEASDRARRYMYGEDVRRQIVDRETVKLAERKALFQEGIKFEEQEKKRKAKVEKVKAEKLETLRQCGIPQKYCHQIERKMNAPERLTT